MDVNVPAGVSRSRFDHLRFGFTSEVGQVKLKNGDKTSARTRLLQRTFIGRTARLLHA